MLIRLAILQTALLMGLGLVLFLPEAPSESPVGVTLELPDEVGIWIGEEQKVGKREREILARDTEFARRVYSNTFGDRIVVSIVLAGHDMVNSIHRPERCLPAQGLSLESSEPATISLGPSKKLMRATKLHTLQKMPVGNGKTVDVRGLNYYWFVGADDLTSSHLQRNLIDIRDRVFRGYSQRWAYVTVTATVTKNLQRFGRSKEETARLIEDFIPQIVPHFQKVLP